ncbi:MAG: Hsp70 family protein [Verrucomicrobiales bacterium]|nr:Hsp70 family protein [Verrucomicrobiales bacterium]
MSSPILGIDLGTTHSLVGVVDSGFPILLADAEGQRLTPSAVAVGEDGSLTVGRAALRQRALHPERVVTSVKRLMGRRTGESDWQPPYDLAALGLTAVDVSAAILRHLKGIAERAMEQPLNRAVITVPAFFNEPQREATQRAAVQAGLQVERLLSEPTAAALAYGLEKGSERQRVAVYDLGGGTFDVSVLELRDGVFEVLATAGNTQLGGDDLDRRIARHLLRQLQAEGGVWEASQAETVLAALTVAAEEAKKALSSAEEAPISLPFVDGIHSLSTVLTRADLERLASPWVDATRVHCQRALTDAGLDFADLDEVVLVGGSTRMPLVRQRVAQWFGRDPHVSTHPDEAIAMGAVIQAGMLAGDLRQLLLLDVTPLSLGIETYGGLMNVLIPRNSTLPCKAGEMFTNPVANQKSMLIRVLQGEREMARDNWELGRVEVPFVPGPKGSARVGVQFSIDADGLLEVLARDTHTGVDSILTIQRTAVDVTDGEVEKMIAESVDHALDDMTERQWTEAAMKGREMVDSVAAAVAALNDGMESEERASLEEAVVELKRLLEDPAQPLSRLKAAIQELDDLTQELAVRLVEQAMEESLQRRGVL